MASTHALDVGEADAISLAKEIGATIILMDEKKGRRVALNEGLTVVRTLALLEVAADRDFVDLRSALQKLQTTAFRVDKKYIDAALARHEKRK